MSISRPANWPNSAGCCCAKIFRGTKALGNMCDFTVKSHTYKTYTTYMTYTTYINPPRSGGNGHEKLVVYWLGVTIYDLNHIFIDRYIDRRLRTYDQMLQSARSGKQNIVEGWLQHSREGNLKLLDISRVSYAELKEDFGDYLRSHNLFQWDKNDPRVLVIRQTRDLPYKTYRSYTTYVSYMDTSKRFSNLMITLLHKESYLLDRLMKSTEQRFLREGGFRENLFRKRVEYKNHGK